MKNALPGFSPISQALIVTAAIAVVVAIVHAAASVIAPMLLAAFIAVVATPPLRWMKRKGLPKWIALAVIVFVLLDVGSLFALVSTGALEGLRDGLPGYQERLVLLSAELGNWLEGYGIANASEAMADIFDSPWQGS